MTSGFSAGLAAGNGGKLFSEADLAVVLGSVFYRFEGIGKAPEAMGVAADAEVGQLDRLGRWGAPFRLGDIGRLK